MLCRGQSLLLLARFEWLLHASLEEFLEGNCFWFDFADEQRRARASLRSKAMVLRLRALLQEDGYGTASSIADLLQWSEERVRSVFFELEPVRTLELIEVTVATGVRLDWLVERALSDVNGASR